MKTKEKALILSISLLALMAQQKSVAGEILTGDTRLACEAILCLSSGTRPSECNPSLSRYFGITRKKWSDTLSARISFLNQCPASNMPGMPSLVNAIVNGAGQCDPTSLNNSLRIYIGNRSVSGNIIISNVLPEWCNAYTGHSYTDLSSVKPVYVGLPERGGYWVYPAEYASALAAYKKRVEEEDRLNAMHSGD